MRVSIKEQFERLTAAPVLRTDAERWDGWSSALSGIGTTTYDKRLDAVFAADLCSRAEAIELWRGDDLAHRVIETKVVDMLREGWTFSANADSAANDEDPDEQKSDRRFDAEDQELQKQITDDYSRLEFSAALCQNLKYERAYGGGAIMMAIRDGRKPHMPVNETGIREITHLTVLEPYELTPRFYYTDPLAPKYGAVEIYELNPLLPGQNKEGNVVPQRVLIHESRLLIAPGIRVSRQPVSGLDGWGDSVLTRVRHVLRDFNMSWAGVGILLNDFSQAIFKMEGLAELIASDRDDVVVNRIKAVELSRSIARCVIVDAKEDFGRVQTPVSGLPELLDRLKERVAAAAEMPITKLFGQSPGGMNATGESDTRGYYDTVSADQTSKLLPAIKRLTTLLLASKGKLNVSWSIEFNPLWQPSAKEKAEQRKLIAEADSAYVAMGAVAPEEVALSRWGGERYSPEMVIDFDNREALEAIEAKEAEEAQRAHEKQLEMIKTKTGDPNATPPNNFSE